MEGKPKMKIQAIILVITGDILMNYKALKYSFHRN